MHNPLIVGRRTALRLAAVQAAVTAALALAFLLQGASAAMAAAVGGAAATVGGAALAWRAVSGGPVSATTALLRLFGGIALKWLVIVATLYLALARFELPPLPLLLGLCAALVAPLPVFGFRS